MRDFEDLITRIRAGIPPSEALPHLRRLFTTLPHPKPPDPTPEVPTSRLFHTLPDDTHVQLPYLRPPFNVWDELECPEPQQPFDTELELDVYKRMHFKFLQPPIEEVLRMLAEWDGGFGKMDMEIEQEEEVEIGIDSKERRMPHDDIERATSLLRDFFCSGEQHVPRFKQMRTREWATAFSRMGTGNALTCERVLRLLRGVHQPGLAEFILFTVVPFLMVGDDHQGFTELVSMAVEKADVRGMDVKRVKQLLEICRASEAGALGVETYLTILKSIANPR